MSEHGGLVLPPGVEASTRHVFGGDAPDSVTIVNDTGLPNQVIEGAVHDTFVENASLAWGRETTFQTYAQQGSMLARSAYQVPTNVIDEIKLARELVERDDDVAGAIGQMLALAFGEGMENHHTDERTVALYNAICENADLDLALMELYRELLISGQINIATLFTREQLDYTLSGSETIRQESLSAPLIGVLPAENIRIIGNDMFRTGVLAFNPDEPKLQAWLEKYFSEQTSPAEKAKMGREDRVSANLFTGQVEVSIHDQLDPSELPTWGGKLYTLNPRMVSRTTFPKGSRKYPRPLLTRNLALLEAKRLLNIMDYALLQGGSNYIVVAKKGTDKQPAQGNEVENLGQVVRRASKTGVIVGDHRLTFEVITPELKELLNPEKRRLLGRKIVMAMLRLSEHGPEEGGTEGIKSDDESIARVIASDRLIVKRLLERAVYKETARRNPKAFKKGAASPWFPKIVLQGTQAFTDYILKLRDRGDIPRSWAVSAAGFDWNAAVAAREREKPDDEVMVPGVVPHSSPEAGPQDNNTGRPKGAKDGKPQDPAQQKRRIGQNPGETIKAWYEPEVERVVRMGEVTYAILEEYPERRIGRVTETERAMLDATEMEQQGLTLYVPVNPSYETRDEKAVRLTDTLSMIVGTRKSDDAIVAKLLCFRDAQYTERSAEELAIRWGFCSTVVEHPGGPQLEPHHQENAHIPAQPLELHVHSGSGLKRTRVLRDGEGNIVGTEEYAADDSLSIFDTRALDQHGRTAVEKALASCSFDFTRLLPQMRSEAGIETIRVVYAKLPRDVEAEIETTGNEGEEVATELKLNQTHRGGAQSVMELAEAFLSECAHLIDFYLLSAEDRKAITAAFPDINGDNKPDAWFDGAKYWDQVGEAFMNAFRLAYSDLKPDQTGFSHKATPAIAEKVKAIVEAA